MALDEDGRRLFVASREPSRFIVLDSDCGKVLTSLPCVDIADEITYDGRQKRIYVAGTDFVDVFHERDAGHYDRLRYCLLSLI